METNVTRGLLNATTGMTGNESIAETSDSNGRQSFLIPWNNPHNIMTQKMSDDITSFLGIYVFPVLTILGIVGNGMSIIVLMQKKMRDSTTSIVLAGLAFSDMMFLIFNAIRKSTAIVERYDQTAADTFNATTFYYLFYLKTAFSRVSTMLVVVISTERFIAVLFPFKVKMLVTRTRMTLVVAMAYVLTLGSLAALPFQYTYTYIRGKAYISQTAFALKNVDSLKIYNEYFLPIVFRHIPVVIVLILNTAIVVSLRRSNQFRHSTKDDKRKDEQSKITRTLLTVALVFLVCLLPGDALLVCSLVVEGFQFFGLYHNLFLALSDICLLFEMINACLNFVIYMVMNKRFYDRAAVLFCGCAKRARSSAPSSQDGSQLTTRTSMSTRVRRALKSYVSSGGSAENREEDISVGADNKTFSP